MYLLVRHGTLIAYRRYTPSLVKVHLVRYLVALRKSKLLPIHNVV
jgi:hypothetical protein